MIRTLPLLVLAGCGASASRFDDAVALLKRDTEVILLSDRGGFAQVAVCPEFQGRVMTSTTAGPTGTSLGWINFDLIGSGRTVPHMNAYGGEDRFWLGPEAGRFGLFFAPGAPFAFDHWQTPAPLDTEAWPVARRDETSVVFEKFMRLTNRAGTRFRLRVRREIRLLGTPAVWRHLGIPPEETLRVVGFESVNEVANRGETAWTKGAGLLSIWILGMFPPADGAVAVVPIREGPEEELGPPVNDAYFGEVPADRLRVDDGVVLFRADGRRRSKIGIPPGRATPVLGSWDPFREVLTIVQYTLPEGEAAYVNSLWSADADPYAGDVVNAYNDGPPAPDAEPLGPFYELETSSPALALRPRASFRHVHRTIHLQGDTDALNRVARRTLGVSLRRIGAFAGGR